MEFRVLGEMQVVVDGNALDLGTRRMERCLLGLFVLHIGSVVSIDRLIDTLWDDRPPQRSRSQIQVLVSRLRSRFAGHQGFELLTRGAGYVLGGDPDRVDAHRFRRLHQAARETGDPASRLEQIQAALTLWRGRVLEDVATDTIRERIMPEYDELWLSGIELRIETELALGRHTSVIGQLTALSGEHPFRERLVELRMLALYRSGRHQDALSAYADFRRTLAKETGLDPRPELEQVHQQILRSDSALDLAACPVPATAVPAQLPAAVPDFVGRASDLERLARQLNSGQPVVINTMSGVGGIGKTALAVYWAHQVRDQFPDGQLYINLHGYSNTQPIRPIAAVSNFLRALGVPAAKIPFELDDASGLYRSILADRRILVVLDNASSADQVRPLLPGGRGSLALITSRDQLSGLVALDGAHRLTLNALAAPEAAELLARIIGAHRVAAEPEAAAELVAFCDHLPLAIRITGALLADQPTKSIAEHAAELGNGNRLDALAIDGDERACVRAAFAQSYRQLATDQSGLFRLLGLVPGPDFTPEATACLANLTLEQAEILLEQLAEIHLVERVSHHRYAFHDLLQEYSVQCGAAEDKPARRATAMRRLYDFYLGRTDAASRRLYPGILRLPMPRRAEPDLDGPAAQSWLDNERANIVAAVIRAADDGLGSAAWLLADAIRGHFYIDQYTVDWIRVAEAALGIAVSHGDIMAQVAGHISLGMAHNHLNQSGMAITHQLVALALAQQSEWLDAESALLNNLGDTYLKLGRLEDAHRALDHATQVLQLIDAPARRAITDSNLGMAEHLLGGSGLRHLTDALTLHRSVGNVNGEADVHRKIGTVHLDNGNPGLAAEHAQAALALIGSSPGRMFETDSLNLLGAARLATGSPHEAIDSHQRALRLATDVDDRYGMAEALLGLAATELSRICPDPTHAERALRIARELGYRILEGQALTTLAELSTQLGDPHQGRKHARAALALQRKTKYRTGVKQARRALDHAIETALRD